jgi:hypothetical protein
MRYLTILIIAALIVSCGPKVGSRRMVSCPIYEYREAGRVVETRECFKIEKFCSDRKWHVDDCNGPLSKNQN